MRASRSLVVLGHRMAWLGLAMVLMALMTLGSGCSSSVFENGPEAQVFTPLWGPYMSGTGTDRTTVSIKTVEPTTAEVHYASEEYYKLHKKYDQKVSDDITGQIHHIGIGGLGPGTVYHYKVICGKQETNDYSFSTLPETGRFAFAVYGDTQDELPNFSQTDRHQLVADRIAKDPDILFVLNTGDMVNDGQDSANWDRYFEASREMGAKKTVYPARGNHDGEALEGLFPVPPYYSFECGDAQFVVLDSVNDPQDQKQWLSQVLAVDKEWKFVLCHHPLYTSEPNHFGGWENLKDEWEGLFIRNEVDAVWSGDVHAYERYLVNDIMYMSVGIGGGPYYVLNSSKFDGYQNSLERSLGYLRVTVDPDARKTTIEVVQVAIISEDGRTVQELPAGTVFEKFFLTS